MEFFFLLCFAFSLVEFNPFQKEVPPLEVGNELQQVLDRVINTHYTKINGNILKAKVRNSEQGI